MKKEENIFDSLMNLLILKFAQPIYKKHKAVILYLFFGGTSFFINIALFALLDKFGVNELINNIICWVVCVLFQFFTNRNLVFEAKTDTKYAFFKQITLFFTGRVFTLVIEELILLIFVVIAGLNAVVIKIIAQVVVILLNYLVSKWFVFKT